MKVSYLGSPPVRFEVELLFLGPHDEIDIAYFPQELSTQRQLLDTARVYFHTTTAGEVRLPPTAEGQGASVPQRVLAVITAVTWGRSVAPVGNVLTPFHVALEPIDYGVLPRSVLRLFALLLSFGFFSLFVIVPWLMRRLVVVTDGVGRKNKKNSDGKKGKDVTTR